MRKAGLTLLVAAALAATALLTMAGTLSDPVRWTPDGLFYQARSLELQGTDRDGRPRAAPSRARSARSCGRLDPDRSGDPEWVAYNAKFYERRITVPAAAAALEPVAGDRAILDISVAGYVAAILAIFALLLLRFSLPVAAAVAAATIALPALRHHSSFPLTDSWGVALQTAAFVFGLLALERGRRWLLAVGGGDRAALVHARQRLDPDHRRARCNPQSEVEGFGAACSAPPSPPRCRRS